MKSVLAFELKRSIKNWRFLLTVVIVLIEFWGAIFPYLPDLEFNDMDWAIWFMSGHCWRGAFMPLTVPLLCVLPHSMSFMQDQKSHYARYMLSRSSARQYILSKYLSTGISAFLALTLPLLLSLVVCFFVFPHGNTDPSWYPVHLFAWVFTRSEIAYCMVVVLNTGIFAFVYSTFALACSAIFRNRYAALLGPTILVFGHGSLLGMVPYHILNLTGLSLQYFFALDCNAACTYVGQYSEIVIVAAASALIFFLSFRKRVREGVL